MGKCLLSVFEKGRMRRIGEARERREMVGELAKSSDGDRKAGDDVAFSSRWRWAAGRDEVDARPGTSLVSCLSRAGSA